MPTQCLSNGTVANGLHIVPACSDDQQNKSNQAVHQHCYQVQENRWQDWKNEDSANFHMVGVFDSLCSFATRNHRNLAIPSKVMFAILLDKLIIMIVTIDIVVMWQMKELHFMELLQAASPTSLLGLDFLLALC